MALNICNGLDRKISRELRSSILYTTCDCTKRNGLQDDCKKSWCRNKCLCLKCPEPKCPPALYARARDERFEREIERRSKMVKHMKKDEKQKQKHTLGWQRKPTGIPKGILPKIEREKEKETMLDYECECMVSPPAHHIYHHKSPTVHGRRHSHRPHRDHERCFEVCEVDCDEFCPERPFKRIAEEKKSEQASHHHSVPTGVRGPTGNYYVEDFNALHGSYAHHAMPGLRKPIP